VAFGVSGRVVLVVIGIAVGLLGVLLLLAWWLAALYFFAALLITSDRLGFASALDPRRLFALARTNHQASLHVAVVYGAATLLYAAVGLTIGFLVPFSSLLLTAALPAVYAVLVPTLASFRVDAVGGPPRA
jgi:hypothetical protein